MNKEVIKIHEELYQIIRKFPEKNINLNKHEDSVTILKQFYHCDTMFRSQGYLYLCNKIINIEYEEL